MKSYTRYHLCTMKQCSGVTIKKTRCERKVADDKSFCWQHKKKETGRKKNSTKNTPRIEPQIDKKRLCIRSGCSERVIDKGHSYCAYHNCSISNCELPSRNGEKYCYIHRCCVLKCLGLKIEGSDCCITHVCQAEGCKESPIWHQLGTNKYCSTHTCKETPCKKQKDASSRNGDYCAEHKKRYALDKPEECPVCLEATTDDQKPWPCGHYVHTECIMKSMKAECPMCRTKLPLCSTELRSIRTNNERYRIERNLANNIELQEMVGQDPMFNHVLQMLILEAAMLRSRIEV